MKVIAVIPARGGSKRVPRKNIGYLGGRRLIDWTLESARQSRVFDEIIVSTEDAIIAEAVSYHRDVTLHNRNIDLARDDTPTLPVIMDVYERHPADIVVTLQCTSPFRTPEDIVQGVELLKNNKGDSVISITEAPNDLAYEIGFAQRLRNIPKVMVPNGALYVITGKALEAGESWSTGIVYGHVMPKDRSLDIDTEQDFEIARMLVRQGYSWLTS